MVSYVTETETNLIFYINNAGERPFPCEICAKAFSEKERLKIHMRTHTVSVALLTYMYTESYFNRYKL